MSAAIIESEELAIEKKEDQDAYSPSAEEEESFSEPSELSAPRWAVVTFEAVAVSGLSYDEAVKWMERLRSQKVSGLCIVTDEAAARISK